MNIQKTKRLPRKLKKRLKGQLIAKEMTLTDEQISQFKEVMTQQGVVLVKPIEIVV